MHNKFDVGKNKNFYNKSKQTSESFTNIGTTHITTEKTKEKIRVTKIGDKNPMFGKKFNISKEIKEKIRISNTGLKRSSETKEKIRKVMSIPTLLLDINFNIIKKYTSCTEIAKELGFTYSNVNNARRFKRMIGKKFSIKYYVVWEKDFSSIRKEEFTIYKSHFGEHH